MFFFILPARLYVANCQFIDIHLDFRMLGQSLVHIVYCFHYTVLTVVKEEKTYALMHSNLLSLL